MGGYVTGKGTHAHQVPGGDGGHQLRVSSRLYGLLARPEYLDVGRQGG
jgi:hypothetical protein